MKYEIPLHVYIKKTKSKDIKTYIIDEKKFN